MGKKLMAIDPSINFCGVAVFDIASKKLDDAILIKPAKITQRDGEFYDKAFSVYTKVAQIQKECNIWQVACELPDHWSVAGYMARESGSITKLAFVCGLLYGIRNDVDKFIFTLPRGWKGQLSKEVLRNRIAPTYAGKGKHYTTEEWKDIDHNVADAIGIGHWRLYGRV